MKIKSVNVNDIVVTNRLRKVKDVSSFVKEVEEDGGIKEPITIRYEEGSPVPILVAGARRLAAAKALKMKRINAIVEEGDSDAARLWEIAENLHRLELTAEERDKHIREYDKLLTKRKKDNKVSVHGGPKPVGRPKTNIDEIAEKAKLSRQTVKRALNPEMAAREKEARKAKEAAAAAKPANEVEAAGFVHTKSKGAKLPGHMSSKDVRASQAATAEAPKITGKPFDHKAALIKAMMAACDKGKAPLPTNAARLCAEAALLYFDRLKTAPATLPELDDMSLMPGDVPADVAG